MGLSHQKPAKRPARVLEPALALEEMTRRLLGRASLLSTPGGGREAAVNTGKELRDITTSFRSTQLAPVELGYLLQELGVLPGGAVSRPFVDL